MTRTALIVTATAAFLLTTNAHAEPTHCQPYAKLTTYLTSKFNEKLEATQIINEKQLIEVWHNPETGSYTMIHVALTLTRGRIGCVLSVGSMTVDKIDMGA